MNSNQHSRQNNRSGRHNHKQNNRGRNQNGRNQRKGGGRKPAQQPMNATKQVDSYGPSGKLRGNVKQLYDQYNAMFLENRSRDRVEAEAHGQYAHHYYSLHTQFAEADAAQHAEKEQAKKEEHGKSNQTSANVIQISEEDHQPPKESDGDVKTDPENKKPEAKSPKKKEPSQSSPELPLDDNEITEKPTRKTAAKKPKKAKETAKEVVAE